MKHLVAVAVVLGLVGIARQAHAGACAPRTWQATIVSPSGTGIPKDGALVVGVTPVGGDRPDGQGNPAVAAWKLGEGKTAVALKAEALAPGLARYTWGTVKPGKHKVVDKDGKPVGEIEIADAAAKKLAAPELVAVHAYSRTWTSKHGPRSGQKHTSHNVTARLKVAPPADALGLILYVGEGDKARPGLYRRVGSKSTDITMYSSPGRCQPHLRGQIQPHQGGKVSAAWIARNGTLSPRSPAVVVSGDAPGRVNIASRAITKTAGTPTGSTGAGTDGKAKDKKKKGCAIAGGDGGAILLIVLGGLLAIRRRS